MCPFSMEITASASMPAVTAVGPPDIAEQHINITPFPAGGRAGDQPPGDMIVG